MYVLHIKHKKKEKIFVNHYLAESYRECGKVKRRIILKLDSWDAEKILRLEQALKKAKKDAISVNLNQIEPCAGKNAGGILVIQEIWNELGLDEIIGHSKMGSLVQLIVTARLLTQGSRRHIVGWSKGEAVEEILGIEKITTDDLYKALDWLDDQQIEIEHKLFQKIHQGLDLYLYDITSSYLEGQQNELAAYGYNRDGKRGKKQIVVGLVCDIMGSPVTTQVFEGNTIDSTTVESVIEKLKNRFEIRKIVLVGDRGMIKKTALKNRTSEDWQFITAITKPQIEKLIRDETFQLSYFEEELAEIFLEDGERYILRKNPVRAKEIQYNRNQKIKAIRDLVQEKNQYLRGSLRRGTTAALKAVERKIKKLRMEKLFELQLKEREISLSLFQEKLEELQKLDGCYVIKTDIEAEVMNKEVVHSRYKDLGKVETAFRNMKTFLLELRPLYHRLAKRTRACVFVCMLAYKIAKVMQDRLKEQQVINDDSMKSFKSCLDLIEKIQIARYKIGKMEFKKLPTLLHSEQEIILDALKVKLNFKESIVFVDE